MSKEIIHIKPPTTKIEGLKIEDYHTRLRIFLAGTIEMGNSRDWQEEFVQKLSNKKNIEKGKIIVLNPRRDNWDSNWEQSIKNKKFSEQVNWEMDMLECSDLIIFNILKDSKSPITLIELGMIYGMYGKGRSRYQPEVLVSCPKGFWKRGNVEIVCKRGKFKLFDSEDKLINNVLKNI